MIDVERNGEVRLRIINAAASTNFTIDLGAVEGTLVTVDGNPIVPLTASRFPLAVAQRADIVLRMPADGSAVAGARARRGAALQTGIVLRPPGAAVAKIPRRGRRDRSRGRTGPGAASSAPANRCRRGRSTARFRSI